MGRGMMREPGATVIKGYRTQACRKSAFLAAWVRACVIPRSRVPPEVLLC